MGKSSTGKDTIYKRLLEDQELGLQRIRPLYDPSHPGR